MELSPAANLFLEHILPPKGVESGQFIRDSGNPAVTGSIKFLLDKTHDPDPDPMDKDARWFVPFRREETFRDRDTHAVNGIPSISNYRADTEFALGHLPLHSDDGFGRKCGSQARKGFANATF